MKLSFLNITLVLATVCKFVAADVPLVYSKENTGSGCTPPQLPQPNQCKAEDKLPDPFAWSNGSGRVKTLADWECRRNEIKAEIENYELGQKPAPPQSVKATYSGNTLTVVVNDNGGSLTLTSKIEVPSGTGPFPIIIGMNTPTGALSGSLFSGMIKVPFMHDQCAKYAMTGNKDRNAPFYKMYPKLSQAGDYIAWSWGVSRLIDGLEQVKDQIHADIQHIGVTGCSYAGKMALFAGAFDERIALTIPQESGGGGINSWRVSDTIGNVEKIDNTNYSWFMQALKTNFGNKRANKLPYDHHELVAMVAPRAFFTMGNPDYEWLGDKSGYTSVMAAVEVWKAMGVEDRFGFNFVGGHSHCQAASAQNTDVTKFIDKYLRGKNTDTSNMLSSTVKHDYSSWMGAWKGHKIDTSVGGSAGAATGNTAGNTAGNTTGNTAGNTTGNTAGNTTGNTTGNTPNPVGGSDACWAKSEGYECCQNNYPVYWTDKSGQWGIENGKWCGIIQKTSCWSTSLGYSCCKAQCPQEIYIDYSGSWGVENGQWCGITKLCY